MKLSTIGVLGGGQLGRMMALAAHNLGMQIAVLDPDRNAPAGQVVNRHVVGDFRDSQRIRELAVGCDILTVEIEHVNADSLDALVEQGIPVHPSPATIRLIQDKYAQKRHLAQQGVPVAPFVAVSDAESAEAAIAQFGLPLLLKSRFSAYDGRGNVVVRDRAELPAAVERLGGYERGLYVEQYIPFERELAIMVARGRDGSLALYPVVETIHHDNILHQVIVPAPIAESIQHEAQAIAHKAIASFEGAGIYGVEMFLLADGTVLINEIAPRPHNSGHYTIEACVTSQFEQHVRAVVGLPLGDTSLKVGAAAMLNILGTGTDEWEATHLPIDRALTVAGASVHWYGKTAIRAQRKVGHITIVGETHEQVQERLTFIRDGAPAPQKEQG